VKRTRKKLNALVFLTPIFLGNCAPANLQTLDDPIISTSLCADGYLHALPELEPRLAALSWQSRSSLSRTPIHLRALPQADNDPERRLKWSDAIQISSAGGLGDIDLSWGEDFETVWTNLELLSSKLEVSDPSEDLKLRLSAINKPAAPPHMPCAGPGLIEAAEQLSQGISAL